MKSTKLKIGDKIILTATGLEKYEQQCPKNGFGIITEDFNKGGWCLVQWYYKSGNKANYNGYQIMDIKKTIETYEIY